MGRKRVFSPKLKVVTAYLLNHGHTVTAKIAEWRKIAHNGRDRLVVTQSEA